MARPLHRHARGVDILVADGKVERDDVGINPLLVVLQDTLAVAVIIRICVDVHGSKILGNQNH